MSSYCDHAPGHEWHGPYHDHEYGFPRTGDAELFERLVLEINQAGLSWLTILKKREAFRQAYDGFDPAVVARYGARQRSRLLADAGIIRNRLKIEAAIHNAGVILQMRESHGGFHPWLLVHHPRPKAEWVRLFRQTFRFTGGGDCRGIPDEHRGPAGGARGIMPGVRPDPDATAGVGEG